MTREPGVGPDDDSSGCLIVIGVTIIAITLGNMVDSGLGWLFIGCAFLALGVVVARG